MPLSDMMPLKSAMDDELFAYATTLTVRWRDLDALAHVNNAVYFTYLEHARVAYLLHLGLVPDDPTAVGIIMAEASCRYRSPLRMHERVTVHIRASEIKNSSFVFMYRVNGQDGRLAATARTVQVCYDYRSERPIRMPRAWREAITRHEPALSAALRSGRKQETTI
jgi:acyl-CoA thioester hydrolase